MKISENKYLCHKKDNIKLVVIKINNTSVNVFSVQFSHSVVSNSMRLHEPQHARPPCPSLTPGVYPNSCPLISDTIQPSHLLSSPSPPDFRLSQHQGLFK